MVAGGCISKVGTGNIIYGKGHAARPVGNTAFAHVTLAIAPGGAGGCATNTVAPCATDCGVSQRVMIGIMYGDRYGSGPITILFGTCSIQITNVHGA